MGGNDGDKFLIGTPLLEGNVAGFLFILHFFNGKQTPVE